MKESIVIMLLVTLYNIDLNSQNIGIGTSDPQAKLHLKSDQGLVTALYEGFNAGLIKPSLQTGDRDWIIITDDPPVGPYGIGAPSDFLFNETAILEFVINTPIGKNVRISFSASHNDPAGNLEFSVQKPGGVYWVDHEPQWRTYSTNFTATTSQSVIRFKVESGQTIIASNETWLDEIKVTYAADPVLMIDDGTQMSGGILQSDAYGNTSWVDLRGEIDQQVDAATQTLSFNNSLNILNIENGNGARISGLSNNQFKRLSLKTDTLMGTKGMHLKFPGKDESSGNFQYNAETGSFSWGRQNVTVGAYATAWGREVVNSGTYGTGWGVKNTVSGVAATAWGQNNHSTGENSTSFGLSNTASGLNSTAWGTENIASGELSSAFGYKSEAIGLHSFVSGYESIASGNYSKSLGIYTYAGSHSEVALGFANYSYPKNSSAWDPEDLLLSVGNGTYTNRNNAFSILKKGYVGINKNYPDFYLDIKSDSRNFEGIRLINAYDGGFAGGGSVIRMGGREQKIHFEAERSRDDFEIAYSRGSNKIHFIEDDHKIMTITNGNKVGINEAFPDYDLHLGNNSAAKPTSSSWTVASDRRLKHNIRPFEGGLGLVQKINPVWFTYNGRASMPPETGIGTIAQELEKIAPFMVTEWEREGEKYKAIDYGAMDFILVNAIKEQQEQLLKYKSRLDSLEAEMVELRELINKQSAHRN